MTAPGLGQTAGQRRLLETIEQDRQHLVDLALLLGNAPSPHAREREVATVVVDWLKANGIRAWLQPITEDSANAVGHLPGTEDGTSLIFDAHMDTGPELPANAPARIRRINQALGRGRSPLRLRRGQRQGPTGGVQARRAGATESGSSPEGRPVRCGGHL